jgi:hypothetical protein
MHPSGQVGRVDTYPGFAGLHVSLMHLPNVLIIRNLLKRLQAFRRRLTTRTHVYWIESPRDIDNNQYEFYKSWLGQKDRCELMRLSTFLQFALTISLDSTRETGCQCPEKSRDYVRAW